MKQYKVLISLVIIVIFIFLAVGSTGNDEEPIAEPEEVEDIDDEVIEETDEAVEEVDEAIEEVEEEALPDKEVLEQELLNIIRDSFEGIGNVELTDETFIIIPTDPMFSSELLAAYEGDPIALEDWEFVVESMKGMSMSMEPMLPGYWIDLRNPENHENSILIVEDGVVLYDFIDD